MHPSRSSLKKPFASIDVATPGQLSVRKNFLSGYGTFQPKAELLKWYGDEAVFPKVFWKFLVEGEPRPNGVKKKRAGGSEEPPRAKRQKTEEAEEEEEDEEWVSLGGTQLIDRCLLDSKCSGRSGLDGTAG
jgi:hypothetical protein